MCHPWDGLPQREPWCVKISLSLHVWHNVENAESELFEHYIAYSISTGLCVTLGAGGVNSTAGQSSLHNYTPASQDVVHCLLSQHILLSSPTSSLVLFWV